MSTPSLFPPVFLGVLISRLSLASAPSVVKGFSLANRMVVVGGVHLSSPALLVQPWLHLLLKHFLLQRGVWNALGSCVAGQCPNPPPPQAFPQSPFPELHVVGGPGPTGDADGKCVCKPLWKGSDCSQCAGFSVMGGCVSPSMTATSALTPGDGQYLKRCVGGRKVSLSQRFFFWLTSVSHFETQSNLF